MRALFGFLACCLLSAVAWAADPDSLDEGRRLLGGPENERAVTLFRKVIAEGEAAKQDARKQQRAGRAHFYLDEDAKAVAALERAATLAPKDALHAYWLGVVWSYSDADKAVAALERAVGLDPKLGIAWLELGKVRERKKATSEALTAFLKAAALQPEDADTRYRAGNALQQADRSEEAIGHYRKALALEPTMVNAGYNLGLLEYLAGRFDKAREAWTAVEPHAADDLQLHAKIVQAFYALERYDEAQPWREKVLRLHATSEDEDTRNAKEFCFDQFLVDAYRVLAYERFEQKGMAPYVVVFHVMRDGKELKRVNLEADAIGKEMGGPAFMLGADEGDTHTTYAKSWKERRPIPCSRPRSSTRSAASSPWRRAAGRRRTVGPSSCRSKGTSCARAADADGPASAARTCARR